MGKNSDGFAIFSHVERLVHTDLLLNKYGVYLVRIAGLFQTKTCATKKRTGASNLVTSAGTRNSSDIPLDELGLPNVDRSAVCGDPRTATGVKAYAQVVRTTPATPTTGQVPDLYSPPS